jgi:hypothetical protein
VASQATRAHYRHDSSMIGEAGFSFLLLFVLYFFIQRLLRLFIYFIDS